MNINNHISMHSAMVGVPQGNRAAVKEQSSESRILDADGAGEAGASEEASEETQAAKQGGKSRGSASARQQQQTHQTQERRVTDQSKTGEQTPKTEEAPAQKSLQNAQKLPPTKPGILDTSKQIQLGFQRKLESETNQETAKKNPDVQKREFANNLKKWVEVEYKQYVKSNEPPYTRGNLREIMAALGDTGSKTEKKETNGKDSVGKDQVSFSKYNQYSIAKATTALNLFTEIPSSEDPSYGGNTGFDLVA